MNCSLIPRHLDFVKSCSHCHLSPNSSPYFHAQGHEMDSMSRLDPGQSEPLPSIGGRSSRDTPSITTSRCSTSSPWVSPRRAGSVGGVSIAAIPRITSTSSIGTGVVRRAPSRSATTRITQIVGVEVRIRLKLQVLPSLALWDVLLKKLRNLLISLEKGSRENAAKRLVPLREERGSNASMANTTSTT